MPEVTWTEIRALLREPAIVDSSPKPVVLGTRIVVCQRGWVAVGRVVACGNEWRIDNAHIVRKWGTTKGLGEIALGGPTESTVLDLAGTVHIHALSVVLTFDCVEEHWPCLT